MQGPRAQIDRKLYKNHMHETLLNYPNLTLREASVFDLVYNRHAIDASDAEQRWGIIEGVKLGISYLLYFIPYAHLKSLKIPVKLSNAPR